MVTSDQPGDLAFPLCFLVAVFADRASAEDAAQTLLHYEVAADDVFVLHFGAPLAPTDLTVRRLGSARMHPLIPADQQIARAEPCADGYPRPLWCSLVLVYVPPPTDVERTAALLRAAHGELLDAEIDLTEADVD